VQAKGVSSPTEMICKYHQSIMSDDAIRAALNATASRRQVSSTCLRLRLRLGARSVHSLGVFPLLVFCRWLLYLPTVISCDTLAVACHLCAMHPVSHH
jgi:hypothetical protein